MFKFQSPSMCKLSHKLLCLGIHPKPGRLNSPTLIFASGLNSEAKFSPACGRACTGHQSAVSSYTSPLFAQAHFCLSSACPCWSLPGLANERLAPTALMRAGYLLVWFLLVASPSPGSAPAASFQHSQEPNQEPKHEAFWPVMLPIPRPPPWPPLPASSLASRFKIIKPTQVIFNSQ